MLTEFLLQRPTLAVLSSQRVSPVGLSPANLSESNSSSPSESAYRVELSPQGLQSSSEYQKSNTSLPDSDKSSESANAPEDSELTPDEERKVQELQKIDQKVRTHEQAHLSAAGGYARGGASYEYTNGPDGARYAVAGHVNMDTGREPSPEATLQKANIVRKAALAPADPSSSDRQIAAAMSKMAQEARQELTQEQQQESATQISGEPSVSKDVERGIQAYKNTQEQMVASGMGLSLVA